MRKPDWPALRSAPGLHEMSRLELLALAVEPFEERNRREQLTARLFFWLDEISKLGIPLEVWIDGSYSTTKPEPEDIDIVVVMTSGELLKNLDDKKRDRFDKLIERAYVRSAYNLDLNLADSPEDLSDWLDFFGKGHDRATTKGIFVMKVPA